MDASIEPETEGWQKDFGSVMRRFMSLWLRGKYDW